MHHYRVSTKAQLFSGFSILVSFCTMKAAALNLPLSQSREISFVWSADVFSVLRALVSVSLGLLLLIYSPCWAAPSVLTASNIRFLFEILQNMFSCALQHLNTTWTLKLLHRGPRPFKINHQGAPSGVLVREVKQHRGREHFVNCGVLLKQREAGQFTSSWTRRRCDHDGRWSWCAGRAHADCRERDKPG